MKKEAFVYTWSTQDEEEAGRFHIRMYGMDEDNRNVCVHVRDFMPYFYIELGDVDESEIQQFEKGIVRNLLQLLNRHPECENGCNFCWKGRLSVVQNRKKLYFHHKKNSFTMFKMEFPNNIQRKRAFFKMQGRHIQVGYRSSPSEVLIHENEANPVLQFCTQRHIDTTGWIRWDTDPEPPILLKQSCFEREISRHYSNIHPLEDKDKASPSPYVLSFDIEVYSSVPSRMPDPTVKEDVIFQISMVFSRDQKTFNNYLLSLGEPTIHKNTAKLLTYQTEKELLLGFTGIIQKENPNVIVGYNIFGFDLMYMIERSKMWRVMDRFDQMGARVRDSKGCAVHAQEKEIAWSSSAYSHQKFYFLDTEGRLFIDLLPVVRRDYKFENYRLKTISEFFIGETKDPITPRDIFEGYRLSKQENNHQLLSRVGKYCVQDSRLVLLLFDKLQTWIGLSEMAKACRVPILTLYTQGQQIKVYSQLYYQCTHDSIVVQSPKSLGENAKLLEGADHYSGAMVFTPDPGVYDWVVPFDFCLAGDTLVSLPNGTSRRIKSLTQDTMVLGHKDGGFRPFPSINGLQQKGVRETVRIVLQDGQTIVATPDHKFMLASGQWCEAKELKDKKVRCSVEFTEDRICPLESDWKLDVAGGVILEMTDVQSREKCLAFARILGYTVSAQKFDRLLFPTMMDARTFLSDLRLLTAHENTTTLVGRTVAIPTDVSNMIMSHAHNRKIPSFIMSDHCPLSFLREFLGGMYGCDPSIHNLTRHHTWLKRLHVADMYDFSLKIGFRYAINKSCNVCAINSHTRMSRAHPNAHITLTEYASEHDMMSWLNACAVGQEDDTIPFYRMKVVDVCWNEPTEVFDIEVEDAHNFIANSVCASNCSLYPTSIIAHNIDFSTLVLDEAVPDELCNTIEWWDHIGCEHDTTVHATKPKYTVCQPFRYRFLKEPVGVIPQLLMNLLEQRRLTRQRMKDVKKAISNATSAEEKASLGLLYSVLDKRQLAYKVSANSAYGAMGVKKGYLPFLPGAMSTTAVGRISINKAANYVREHYNGKIIYGDSVASYTPVYVRRDGVIDICRVEDLAKRHGNNEWFECLGEGRGGKESCDLFEGTETWTESGWTTLERVIRHVLAPQKKMVRVATETSIVDVTDDHSLVLSNGKPMSPKDVEVGVSLMCSHMMEPNQDTTITVIESNIHGFFFRNGTCSRQGGKSVWYMEHSCPRIMTKYQRLCKMAHPSYDWDVSFTLKGMYRLIPRYGDTYTLTDMYLTWMYYDEETKIIPSGVLNGTLDVRKMFWNGLKDTLSTKDRVEITDQLVMAQVSWLAASIGKRITVMCRVGENVYGDQYTGVISNHVNMGSDTIIRHIWKDVKGRQNMFVYDLTTENHHFAAGIGDMIVHNTDSIYCHFPLPNQENFAAKLWEHAKNIEDTLISIFPRPMKLAFEEKLYKKFLILTKKRYMALTCDHRGLDEDKLTIRGVLLARRDNAKWVRRIYEHIVRSIMACATLPELVEKLIEELNGLFRGQDIPLKQFIVSKTLGKDYAIRPPPDDEKKLKKRLEDLGIDPKRKDWQEVYNMRSQPAHAQLAEKMKRRGTVVEPGSRIEYVVVQHPDKNPKLFERLECPVYMLQHSDLVRLDPLYYAQNMVNPVDQVLEVCFKKKDVVQKIIQQHADFRVLMEELMWHFHPYVFEDTNGVQTLPPFAVRFKRAMDRRTKKVAAASKKKNCSSSVKTANPVEKAKKKGAASAVKKPKKTDTTAKKPVKKPTPIQAAKDFFKRGTIGL